MPREDDIVGAIPMPPKPSPDRRDAAIAEAVQRFDARARLWRQGRDKVPPASARWWAWIARPRIASFASILLVALVSVPLVWNSFGTLADIPAGRQVSSQPVPALEAEAEIAAAEMQGPDPAIAMPESPSPAASSASSASEPQRAVGMIDAAPAEFAMADAATHLPAPPPAMRVFDAREERAGPAPQTAAPMRMGNLARPASGVAASDVRADEADAESIIVTSAKMRPRKASARGDWNSCTVDDPAQDEGRCTAFLRPARKGAAARSDALVGEGLQQAWAGNLAGAIRSFDAAIAAAPQNSFAYLNRGLAHRRSGDLVLAITDLDSAVRHSPVSARNYYNRSVLLRERGDTKRAARDEERAVQLDPRYADLFGD